MVDLVIPRVRVLTGHVDAETAYLVDDYPYGYSSRCQIRYWIETRLTGKIKGDQRFVTQTTDPRVPGTVWNKPKPSTYSAIKVMYLDGNGHVKPYGVECWLDGAADVRTRHMGVYDAFTDDQRKRYDALLAVSRAGQPNTWARWDKTVAALAEHINQTGDEPVLVNHVWTHEGTRYYLSDPAAYMTAARALIDTR